jgi:hypothetical protein
MLVAGCLLMSVAVPANAQAVADRFGELGTVLKSGERIDVTDEGGTAFKYWGTGRSVLMKRW